MNSFLKAIHSSRVLLMDGAMGTELLRAGLKPGDCHELWNLTHPDRVRAIHQAYRAAGAECLLANTFQANPLATKQHGQLDQLPEIIQGGIALARSIASPDGFVLADLGPMVARDSTEEFADANLVRQIVPAMQSADAILVETCSSPAALEVAHRLGSWQELPVLLSLTYRRTSAGDLETYSGHAPEWFGGHARARGISALGVNCGRDLGMEDIIAIVRRYRQVTDLPLFARPNAGTPAQVDDLWVYPHTPIRMAARLPELLEAGVCMVGGCCGTTPEHIAAWRPVIDDWNARHLLP